MAQITLPDDAKVVVPLAFQDSIGAHASPPSGGVVSVDDAAVATASLQSDGAHVEIVAVADGTCTVSYSATGVTVPPLTVTVQPPVATVGEFDTADAVFSPKS